MAFPTVVVVKEDGSVQTVIDVTMEDDVYEATTEEVVTEHGDLDDEIDVDVMPFCAAHKCLEPVAELTRTPYCAMHRCIRAFCHLKRDDGHNFCFEHRPRCGRMGCTRKLTVDDTILGTKFCGVHQCRHPECTAAWDEGCEGFCSLHVPMQLRGRQGFCAVHRCFNYPLGNLIPFCAVHAQRNSDL
jgi:hypothetical protein